MWCVWFDAAGTRVRNLGSAVRRRAVGLVRKLDCSGGSGGGERGGGHLGVVVPR